MFLIILDQIADRILHFTCTDFVRKHHWGQFLFEIRIFSLKTPLSLRCISSVWSCHKVMVWKWKLNGGLGDRNMTLVPKESLPLCDVSFQTSDHPSRDHRQSDRSNRSLGSLEKKKNDFEKGFEKFTETSFPLVHFDKATSWAFGKMWRSECSTRWKLITCGQGIN